ncbi:unnamed protein product [Prorocentrum cordatum]|uniref:Ion transport domain-containing protein n=1 Tax=Prorocentrum cordatum TaxID=2364126 RepID=A0ABN9WDE9_9DINO|nr:unnamed protein product [Polarella glacialis]
MAAPSRPEGPPMAAPAGPSPPPPPRSGDPCAPPGAQAPAPGFEGLLQEALEALRLQLLERHRQELEDQRRQAEVGRGARRQSTADSEGDVCWPDAASSGSGGALSLVAAEEAEISSVPSGYDGRAPTAQAPRPHYVILESWVSAVPVSQLAAVGSGGEPLQAPLGRKNASMSGRARKTASLGRARRTASIEHRASGASSAKADEEDDRESNFLVFESRGFVSRWFMVHPDRWRLTVWNWLSLWMVFYDVTTVPLYTFYTFGHLPNEIVLLDWLARVFWTLDIPLSFTTGFYKEGYIEMRPKVVARAYVRSWLPFDILVVLSDWLAIALEDNLTLAAMPVLRLLRFVRMFRLLRLSRLSHMISEIMLFVPEGFTIVVRIAKFTINLCIGIHVVACMWYGVGRSSSSGWVSQEPLLESSVLSEQYIFSVHWVISQLHGTSFTRPQTFLEISFQSLVLLGAHAFVAVFVASLTQAMMAITDTQRVQMQQVCRRYLRRRHISPALSYQVAAHFGGSSQRMGHSSAEVEDKLVESMPLVLQLQLYEEVRMPLLRLVPLFRREGLSNHRLLRELCCKAISGISLVSGELVFGLGDSCKRMIVVESGSGVYMKLNGSSLCVHAFGKTLTNYVREEAEESDVKHVVRQRGQHVSEAALWTQWVNRGEFFSEGDCTMLVLDHGGFASIVSAYESARIFALKYASCFVAWLNDVAGTSVASDVMEAPRNLLERYIEKVADDSALVFISHFKEEAGSDAALMEEGMRRIIKANPVHPSFNMKRPIFLDSNDLVETDHIQGIIRSSHNVVLLLTDNVLTRPWVLIEIVTALQAGVPVHLVMIHARAWTLSSPARTPYGASPRALASAPARGPSWRRRASPRRT